MKTMNTKYPSSIDTWIAFVLIGSPLLAIGSGIFVFPKSTAAGLTLIAMGFMSGALIAMLAWPCYYSLEDKHLRIKCGISKEDILIDRIKSVERSSSLWSAPALSLKRVKIVLDDGFRLVSPADREAFIEALEQRIRK
jgi:uncharacterized membrane protein YdbT with pleckstrin-like domain